jgi:hypothetical protein
MAKASMTLPDGTTVIVKGSPEEIQRIISLHRPVQKEVKEPEGFDKKKRTTRKESVSGKDVPDLPALVSTTKSCKEFDQIEANILDRSSVVDRLLLPLYIAHEYVSENLGLTSGEITKYLSQFSVNIAQPNVAKNLSSTASRYVIGYTLRVKGKATRYRISRKGLAYIKSVIKGKSFE